MTLKEPIIEGAYYERGDGAIGVALPDPVIGFHGTVLDRGVTILGVPYWSAGIVRRPLDSGVPLSIVRRVYIVPTDPAEVVAELRRRADSVLSDNTDETDEWIEETWTPEEEAIRSAADLVAEKLGVKS